MKNHFALLAAVMLISLKSFAADFSVLCSSGQTLYYNILDDENHTVEVTYPGSSSGSYAGYTKPVGNIIFPSTLSHNGISYTIIRIGNKAFYDCIGITGITLSSTIQSIGESAFEDCGITSINIPLSVEFIGGKAFYNNPVTNVSILNPEIVLGHVVLGSTPWYSNQPWNSYIYIGTILYAYNGVFQANSTVSINEGTTSIASWAFPSMGNVVAINIPNSVRVIGDYVFSNASQVASFAIPSNLKWIGSHAFEGCGGFSTLTLPTVLETIGDGAFSNCDGLTTLIYNAQNCKTGNLGMVFHECDNFETLDIGNSVRSIPRGLFYGCSHINNLTIANGVDTISQQAFQGCSSITTITIPESVDYIDKWAFKDCTSLNTINYNAANCHTCVGTEQELPFQNCNAVTSIVLGNNVQTIPSYIFYHTHITSLTIPENVTLIESKAFANCYLLSSLVFNASSCQSNCTVSGPFYGCSSLTNVTFGNNVHNIPDGLFSHALTASVGTMDLPNTLTYIGRDAFNSCTGMSGVLSIPNGVSKINHSSFSGCTGLMGIIIPNSVTVIDTNAFYLCNGVTHVTIGAAIDTIRSNAFAGLSHLNTINWDAINCRSVDERVFSGDNIRSFITGSSVQTIPDHLIYGCYNLSLSSVLFSNTLYRIGADNFRMCGSGIVHLPASLTNIGYGAFNGCWGISIVQCDAITPPIFEPEPQNGTYLYFANPNTPLYVPCESLDAYRSALGWSYFDNVLGTENCNYTIVLAANNPAMGTVIGGGTYGQGASVTIIASPYSGYKFERWSDGVTQPQRTIIVNEDITLIAYFAPITNSLEECGFDDLQIYSLNKEIVIGGAEGLTISIFSVDGRQIAMVEKADHQAKINVPTAGIYIVKVGAESMKKIVIQ